MAKTETIRNWFEYHAPATEKDVRDHELVRQVLLSTALFFDSHLPDDTYEKDMAIDLLRDAMFWANAALACHREKRGRGEDVEVLKRDMRDAATNCYQDKF